MSNLIILRLYPNTPCLGADFTNVLNGLKFEAFDLSFADSTGGTSVGVAEGNFTPGAAQATPGINQIDINNTPIVQHWTVTFIFGIPVVEPLSIATVVIQYDPPAGHAEFEQPDVLLKITYPAKAGLQVVDQNIDFNAPLYTMAALSTDPNDYITLPAAIYVGLPDPGVVSDPNDPTNLTLPSDGSPPAYDKLLAAVDAVVKGDPDSGKTTLQISEQTPFTAAQAKQIAYELAWNRTLNPVPSLPNPKDPIEKMFTLDLINNLSSSDQQQVNADRQQFEADLTSYYATLDAAANRLTPYVYALSAAIWAEGQTKQLIPPSAPALSVGPMPIVFSFPVDPSLGTSSDIAQITLNPAAGLPLNFDVPAQYFYALGYSLSSQINARQRYLLACTQGPATTVAAIQSGIDANFITLGAITPDGAVDLLNVLGTTGASDQPQCPLDADIQVLVNAWAVDPSKFDWKTLNAQEDLGLLDLVLCILTDGNQALMTAIKGGVTLAGAPPKPVPIADVSGLDNILDTDWTTFFTSGAGSGLLPGPGTPTERLQAFLRTLSTFFSIAPGAGVPVAPVIEPVGNFELPKIDAIASFVQAYDVCATSKGAPVFSFGITPDPACYQSAIKVVFPGDPDAQCWLDQTLSVILFDFQATTIGQGDLQFSLMEALYSVGFISLATVQGYSLSDFTNALTGTVAYPFAAEIYQQIQTIGPIVVGPSQTGASGFVPVNPDGLVNCVPPPWLSPLGPVAYLSDLLKVTQDLSCDLNSTGSSSNLGTLIASRRGDLSALQATATNLETPLPMIDLVNESLEALAAGSTSGAVYQTNPSTLAGHKLHLYGTACPPEGGALLHDPATLFGAIPEHSSPGVPVAQPKAYDALKTDFSAPALPYDQQLDIVRSYLCGMGTTRHKTMRAFRRDITEFVIDPANEPADFQTYRRRYPVRIDIAREYLCISDAEFNSLYSQNIATAVPPAAGQLLIWELYGFTDPIVGNSVWTDIVVQVPEFLKRTGLTYCEFLELWQCGFVSFKHLGGAGDFPQCEPCCPDGLSIVFTNTQNIVQALVELAVFIRLWRTLRCVGGARYTFSQLCDICTVLQLFTPAGAINPDFIRQLAAFQMLRDDLGLPLGRPAAAPTTGSDRTPLLALWVGAAAANWGWAVSELLSRVGECAEAEKKGADGWVPRTAEFAKIIQTNLESLSILAGFDPAAHAWSANPASTLRFAEVLSKIWASDFTVGEILFLFTNSDHLDGDDPFEEQDDEEALDWPLNLPDGDRTHSLWSLREKLLRAEVDDHQVDKWTWHEITASLRDQFGYAATPASDALESIGQHFFPHILEHSGLSVTQVQRQYRKALPGANPSVWNMPPRGPFQFDPVTQELWTELPLRDVAVNEKLSHTPQLSAAERNVVQELYLSPRIDLAAVKLIFSDFTAAQHRLIEESDEHERWRYFRQEFALFHTRCHIIADHLTEHVIAVSDQVKVDGALAWDILKSLLADENQAATPWEVDSGAPPANFLWPQPIGGGFAALLGLTGTGLLGEFSTLKGTVVWRETRGPMCGLGREDNDWDAPIPTVLPALDLAAPGGNTFATLHNGYALRDSDGESLGGGEGFTVTWSGVLLVDDEGSYEFFGGAPTEWGREPDFETAQHHHWHVTLERGQKTWQLLGHRWQGVHAPGHRSGSVYLLRGAYDIVITLRQDSPDFTHPDGIRHSYTGFEVKYKGPDSRDDIVVLPIDRLYIPYKDSNLNVSQANQQGAVNAFLGLVYTSTLRDIRRTYQRAFKAMLFSHCFRLSAHRLVGHSTSQIGYMFAHAQQFMGTSYYPTGGAPAYASHNAFFNFNFLPVSDPYFPPAPAQDDRVAPSVKRQQAIFDWWERCYDYDRLSHCVPKKVDRPVWLLFLDATDKQPADPSMLLWRLGIDSRFAPLVFSYYSGVQLSWSDLQDERWAIRVAFADAWVRESLRRFTPTSITNAQPSIWACDNTDAEMAVATASITSFYQDGCFENGQPRRYDDVKQLNDCLREHARKALLAYLCGMDRVKLPWGANQFAQQPRDLSDLLLQDVEVGVCEKASRIEEAVTVLQTYIERARLGLEPDFMISLDFVCAWDATMSSFRAWQSCRSRMIYRENWIEWDELKLARETEAYRFLESELRSSTLTVPKPGGMEYWPGSTTPPYPELTLLQDGQPSHLRLIDQPENLGLMGLPERDARLSWLAPAAQQPKRREDPIGASARLKAVKATETVVSTSTSSNSAQQALDEFPLWIQAAIKLGAKFVRIGAASPPPASASFECREVSPSSCCCQCGKVHPPVIDEYYFWLIDAEYYSSQTQDADLGTTTGNNVPSWETPDQLPGLLYWPSSPMVRLAWSRVHNGEFQPPRRSDEGVLVNSIGSASLQFIGRFGDSLKFSVTGGLIPTGYTDPEPPGFRYDMPSDYAVQLPLVVPPSASTVVPPGGLAAYPFFAYYEPGATLEPRSWFSVAIAAAASLRTHCQYEAALKWYDLIFKPLAGDCQWARCPDVVTRTVPTPGTTVAGSQPGTPNIHATSHETKKRQSKKLIAATVAETGSAGQPQTVTEAVVERQPSDNPCCQTEAVSDEIVHERSILLHYLDTLAEMGAAAMCRHSREGYQKARLIFDTMARILGECPPTIFSQDDATMAQTVGSFKPNFAPLNPRLMVLYEQVQDRIACIHHCITDNDNCGSQPRVRYDRMPFFGNSQTRDGWKSASAPCECDDECCCCRSPYRFEFLIQKAQQIAGDVSSLGQALLAAYEKGDAEYLSDLRALHERQVLDLTLDVRQNEWREADWQMQALQKSKEETQARLQYYTKLTTTGTGPDNLIGDEVAYETLLDVSLATRIAGDVVQAVAGAEGVIPNMWTGVAGWAGTPLFFTQLPIGTPLAAATSIAGHILYSVAEAASTSASLALTQAGWDRREAEWKEQVIELAIQIAQIERQILAAERRRDIALRQLNIHKLQMEQSADVQNFLRDKFTNHSLYLFLQQETAGLYHQVYDLAICAARQAQRAYNYERGHTTRRFLPEKSWDGLHEGLMAGDRLQCALTNMDKAYCDLNVRECELTKHLSLRLNFPSEFLRLKATGSCDIDVPEWMFDLDYPGQYMRRIKNLSVTIPCVVGPYSGIHCRVILMSSITRVEPTLIDVEHCCCAGCECENGYKPIVDDPRIVRQYAATEAIATSAGQNDSGLFELNFRDQRYLPFEYQGAVSRWRLELPQENNQFDVDTVTDFVMHLNYTAREGGGVLKAAAHRRAQSRLPGNGVRYFDMKRDFADSWQVFQGRAADSGSHRPLVVRLGRTMFPFIAGACEVTICQMSFFFETHCVMPGESVEIEFRLRRRAGQPPNDHHEGKIHRMRCVASADWPNLYQGVLDVEIGPLGATGRHDEGEFIFPACVREVSEAYLLCTYRAPNMNFGCQCVPECECGCGCGGDCKHSCY